MIPQTLVIEGLYSYRQRVEIDFGPLTAARLFGIFGSVGSGKSTILEAIGLALFGETVRLNRGDNRSYNIMNLRSDRLWIDFCFLNRDGGEYRFTLEARRKGTDFESVGSFRRHAYRRDEDEWIPLEHSSGEIVLGVTYENFRRTVIIPQGRFQEFLQLGVRDRTEMLKDLFGLNRFDLFRPTRELLSATVGKIDAIDAVLRELPEELDREIVQAEKRVAEIANRRTAVATEQEVATAHRERLTAVAELLREQEELRRRREELTAQAKRIESQRSRLALLESVREVVLLPYREHRRATDAEREAGGRHAAAHAAVEPVEMRLVALDERFAQLTVAEEQIPERIAYRDALTRALEYRAGVEELRAIDATVASQRRRRDALQSEVEQFRSDEERLGGEIVRLREGVPATDVLRRAEKARYILGELDELDRRTEDIEREIESLLTQTGGTESLSGGAKNGAGGVDNRTAAADNQTVGAESRAVPAPETDTALAFSRTVDQLSRWSATERERRTDGEAFRLIASTLQAGEPCPVCGSVEHPAPAGDRPRDGLDDATTDATAEEDADLVAVVEEALHRLVPAYEHACTRRLELQEQIAGLSDGDIDIGTTARDLEDLWKREGRAVELEGELAALRTQREERVTETARLGEELAATDGRIAEITRRIGGIEENVPVELREGRDAQDLKREIEQIDRAVESIREDLKRVRDERESARREAERMRSVAEERLSAVARARGERETSELRLQEALATVALPPESDLDEVIRASEDTGELRRQIEEFDTVLAETKRRENTLMEKLSREPLPELDEPIDDAIRAAAQSVAAAGEALKALDRESGEVSHRLSQLQAQLKRRRDLNAEREVLAARKANLDTLKRLFTGNGFVTFVAQVFLEQLVAIANDRFRRLTRNSLELALRGSDEFEVIDFLNGGRRRSVKTLSGGQTFQAALCLALALVDTIDHTGGSDQPGFFFLDEGFGSLDQEALKEVFATLTDLRRENRIVGVISHVESLQQEIDTFLRVVAEQDSGSAITASYG